MCTAIFKNNALARTTDRVGLLHEHRIEGKKSWIGGKIVVANGEIWIDGLNQSGLMIALLNYRKELTAESTPSSDTKTRLHPGELIPNLLESCRSAEEACAYLGDITLTADAPEMYPHYILGDGTGRCTVYENGIVRENPTGVLANAPSLEKQKALLPDLHTDFPAIPWNHTSESRFQRAAWLRMHACEPASYTDWMNLLDAVAVPEGMDPRKGYRTMIRTVMNSRTGVYAYSTEKDRAVRQIAVGQTGEFALN